MRSQLCDYHQDLWCISTCLHSSLSLHAGYLKLSLLNKARQLATSMSWSKASHWRFPNFIYRKRIKWRHDHSDNDSVYIGTLGILINNHSLFISGLGFSKPSWLKLIVETIDGNGCYDEIRSFNPTQMNNVVNYTFKRRLANHNWGNLNTLKDTVNKKKAVMSEKWKCETKLNVLNAKSWLFILKSVLYAPLSNHALNNENECRCNFTNFIHLEEHHWVLRDGNTPSLAWCKCHYVAQGRARQPTYTGGMSLLPAERTGYQDLTSGPLMTNTIISNCY